MTNHRKPSAVFCLYAQEDEAWLQKIESHLSVLKQQGFISLWHPGQVLPGVHIAQTCADRLEEAAIVLLLLSADFLASYSHADSSIQRVLERHQRNEVHVIPIVLRPCDWTNTPFAAVSYLPRNGMPITLWENQDAALLDIAQGIRQVVTTFHVFSTLSTNTSIRQLSRQSDEYSFLVGRGRGVR